MSELQAELRMPKHRTPRCNKLISGMPCKWPIGHGGICSPDKPIEAIVQAALEKAAEHYPIIGIERLDGIIRKWWIYCSCGFEGADWQAHIRQIPVDTILAKVEGRGK